ncbi:MAG: D-alanine--D-alanine ligase [Clostridiales bacterium]|jgi:D-alanine-D-alanine ligase|nr:D-alanine--D-alanine ligase [Clostridiales bacterium]
MKKNILVIFGGKSCEHDISIITALQAMRAANEDKYEVFPLYIRKKMYSGGALRDLSAYADFSRIESSLKTVEFFDGGILVGRSRAFKKRVFIDAAVVCCHGGIGENGGLQGLLEFYNIPYTSPGVSASAVFMDKVLTKEVLKAKNLPVLPYFTVKDTDIENARARGDLTYPLIVKPASLGSSIGIGVAHNIDELKTACVVAAEFDSKIIVEKALTDFFEINCAALSDGKNIIVSECEKPVSWEEFLSFDEKYCVGGGMRGLKREYPADIPENLRKAVRNFTRTVYAHFGMKGSVRIDFLVDGTDGGVYINEINTVPGSLAYYLFAENGITFRDLIDITVETAKREKARADKKQYIYDSKVLDGDFSGKTGKA